jgi:hypothetical protein
MGSASSEAAGLRFIEEFGNEVIETLRPRSPALDALVDGMWLAITDGWEDVRLFVRLRDGSESLVLSYPDPVFVPDAPDDGDLVAKLVAWTAQPEVVVRERLARARL